MPEPSSPKLTPEFCRANRLTFYPGTPEEAVFIQERLAEFGIRWVDDLEVGARATACVAEGMLVDGGQLYYGPTATRSDVVCTASQFEKDFVPPERTFLMEQFSKIFARLDEMSSRLAEVERKTAETHEALFPKIEDIKPSLRRGP